LNRDLSVSREAERIKESAQQSFPFSRRSRLRFVLFNPPEVAALAAAVKSIEGGRKADQVALLRRVMTASRDDYGVYIEVCKGVGPKVRFESCNFAGMGHRPDANHVVGGLRHHGFSVPGLVVNHPEVPGIGFREPGYFYRYFSLNQIEFSPS
jgi:hypothetical protein